METGLSSIPERAGYKDAREGDGREDAGEQLPRGTTRPSLPIELSLSPFIGHLLLV